MILNRCASWPSDFEDLYRKEDCWRGETFGGMLEHRAKSQGKCIAITSGERNLTYSELDSKADSLAAGFQKLGIVKSDRVVVQLPNIIEFF